MLNVLLRYVRPTAHGLMGNGLEARRTQPCPDPDCPALKPMIDKQRTSESGANFT